MLAATIRLLLRKHLEQSHSKADRKRTDGEERAAAATPIMITSLRFTGDRVVMMCMSSLLHCALVWSAMSRDGLCPLVYCVCTGVSIRGEKQRRPHYMPSSSNKNNTTHNKQSEGQSGWAHSLNESFTRGAAGSGNRLPCARLRRSPSSAPIQLSADDAAPLVARGLAPPPDEPVESRASL